MPQKDPILKITNGSRVWEVEQARAAARSIPAPPEALPRGPRIPARSLTLAKYR
jgi:hypothetical protein